MRTIVLYTKDSNLYTIDVREDGSAVLDISNGYRLSAVSLDKILRILADLVAWDDWTVTAQARIRQATDVQQAVL